MSWWKGYKRLKELAPDKKQATVRNVTDNRREIYYSRSIFNPWTGEEKTVGPDLITIEELEAERARLIMDLADITEMIADFQVAADDWVAAEEAKKEKEKEGNDGG